jgi:aspartate/methionine/tyrosine aminotransferase
MRNRAKLAERNLGIIKDNLAVIADFFSHHKDLFSWIPPQAGSMAFPRLLKGDVEEFCDRLVKEAGVLLLPGSIYDDSRNHFRLGLGRKNLPQGVQKLEMYLSTE